MASSAVQEAPSHRAMPRAWPFERPLMKKSPPMYRTGGLGPVPSSSMAATVLTIPLPLTLTPPDRRPGGAVPLGDADGGEPAGGLEVPADVDGRARGLLEHGHAVGRAVEVGQGELGDPLRLAGLCLGGGSGEQCKGKERGGGGANRGATGWGQCHVGLRAFDPPPLHY